MAMGAITRYRINWKNRAQMVDFDDGVRFARCCWKGVLGSQSVLHEAGTTGRISGRSNGNALSSIV